LLQLTKTSFSTTSGAQSMTVWPSTVIYVAVRMSFKVLVMAAMH